MQQRCQWWRTHSNRTFQSWASYLSELPIGYAAMRDAFVEELKEAGYIEGQNVRIEYRWAESKNNLLPQLAADLARQKVAVMFVNGPAALPAKNATKSIP